MAELCKTVIIGLGNPLLGDDGVGIRVVRRLRERLPESGELTIVELPVGGLRLMEAMVGYDRAIIVDAILTGNQPPGTVRQLRLNELELSLHSVSSHDTSLGWAMECGRKLGLALPGDITIWGIEADRLDTFGESMTEEVAAAVTTAEQAIVEAVGVEFWGLNPGEKEPILVPGT